MDDDILSLEKAAMERWRNGDAMGFVELSTDDISYVDLGLTRPIHGLDKYQAYMKQEAGKVYYQRSEFIDPKVVTRGAGAVLSYNYLSTRLRLDGSIVSQHTSNATEVYFRRNGEWKIVHTHWSSVRHRVPDEVEIPLPVQSMLHVRKEDPNKSQVLSL